MPTIQTNTVPWDLTVAVGDERIATRCPTWAAVRRLGEIERTLADPARADGLEDELREAVRLFCPAGAHGLVARLGYADLMDVFAAASSYFEAWLKKKRTAAITAGRAAAGGGPAGGTASSRTA